LSVFLSGSLTVKVGPSRHEAHHDVNHGAGSGSRRTFADHTSARSLARGLVEVAAQLTDALAAEKGAPGDRSAGGGIVTSPGTLRFLCPPGSQWDEENLL
jgi:hypothetical protein